MRPGDTMPYAHPYLIHNSLGLFMVDPDPAIPHSFPSFLLTYSVILNYYDHDDLTFAVAI